MPNAVAVLFRVFMELSVDHYMDGNGMPTKETQNGHTHDKNLKKKVEEAESVNARETARMRNL